MNEYISKQKVLEILNDKYLLPETKYKRICALVGTELLNCSECLHYQIKGNVTNYGYCDMWNYPVDDFGFCNYGRKEQKEW